MLEVCGCGLGIRGAREPSEKEQCPKEDQIDRDNVHELRMVWSRGLAPGRQEGTPLAYDGVLYMPQANDIIEAIDAVTGDLKWQHRRDLRHPVAGAHRARDRPGRLRACDLGRDRREVLGPRAARGDHVARRDRRRARVRRRRQRA